jgi:hypothetical protein
MTLIYTPPGSQGGHGMSEGGNLSDDLPNKVMVSLLDLQNSLFDIPRQIFGKIRNKKNKI